jgi:UDP-N-acetyl-D-mannosaminuronic acid dehydrogenase
MTKKSISVIGLGYVGLPLAIMLAKAGFVIKGYDINTQLIDKLSSGIFPFKEEELRKDFEEVWRRKTLLPSNSLESSDVYFIAVPTPVKEPCHTADMEFVNSAAKSVAGVLKPKQIVVIESTIPLGATKSVKELIAKESGLPLDSFSIAYCPERILPGNIKYELQHNDRLIGADSPETARIIGKIYSSFLTEGRLHFTSPSVAEMCKLVENTYRDINIAFANELSIICERLGINVFEVIELANKHPRVNILSPGVGVGGHCIPVDPWFIVEKFPEEAQLIRKAREINLNKTEWIADQVEKTINYDHGKTIGVLGLAYKANVDDLRESPGLHLVRILKEREYNVLVCEPNVEKTIIDDEINLTLKQIVDNADFLIVTVPHSQFMENMNYIRLKPVYCCFDVYDNKLSTGVKTA